MSDAEGKLTGAMTDCIAKEGLPVFTFSFNQVVLGRIVHDLRLLIGSRTRKNDTSGSQESTKSELDKSEQERSYTLPRFGSTSLQP